VSEHSAQAVYLFCFARAGLLATIDGTGVDGRSALWLQRFDDIVAVLSNIATADFCGPAAELRLQDPAWVVQRALCHDRVIERVMRYSVVAPVRFGTIFATPASLADCLERNHAVISTALDALADTEEWAVKGFVDRRALRNTLCAQALAAEERQLTAMSPGLRYLREQRVRADVEAAMGHRLREVCRDITRSLGGHAVDVRRRQVVSAAEGTGKGRQMLLNWAFLVPRAGVADFRGETKLLGTEHADLGITIECTGPWAPYSFCPTLGSGRSDMETCGAAAPGRTKDTIGGDRSTRQEAET